MTDLQIVVPMAGEGQRFLDAGYDTPKPLIPICGVPMVVRAVRDLPPAARVVLLVRTAHMETHGLDRVLREHLPEAVIVPVTERTEGQACTVRLAADHLEPAAPVIVAACDNTHLYDRARHDTLLAQDHVEALVWTYRGEPRVMIQPTSHGWVAVDGERVHRVSCKVPISDNPITDHVVSGFFSFARADTMIDAIDRLVASDERVNGEFYMDVVPNILLAEGRGVAVFEVEKYIGWGTPADYEDYRRWERYITRVRR